MELELVTQKVTQKGNFLNAQLCAKWEWDTSSLVKLRSREFVISDAVLFQVRVTHACAKLGAKPGSVDNYTNYNCVYVRFTKRRDSDDLTYLLYFNSESMNIVGKTFTSDDGTWHLIHENGSWNFTFDVKVEMILQPSLFAGLHEDTKLTDFELRGKDGSVRMHRAVLAVASPVLSRMLGGEWREAAEGHVDVTGTSKATLEQLKNFVYLHVLPESEQDLEQLLLLSSYYIMPELERLCADRLVRGGNAYDLIEFAMKNKVKTLLSAVLECVHNGSISVKEICDHLDEKEVSEP